MIGIFYYDIIPAMKHLHELSHQGLLWVNVTKQQEAELNALKKRFGFLDADLQECLPPFQRPKIVKRPGYLFLVLHWPVFDRETKRLGFTEIDFFVSENFLVTVHDSKLITIGKFFDECKTNASAPAEFFAGTAAHLLLELLSRLLDAVFPILLHVNEDITLIDRKLFARLPGKVMAQEILRLKTNVVTFRRTMLAHTTVLDRLVRFAGRELNIGAHQNYLNSLREFSNEIWNMLASQKESIDALHETNESLLSLRTNDVMRTLTIISVITFPLTLVTTLFAIRAPGTPFINWPGGFLAIAIFIGTGATAMLLVFKRKGWLE